MLHALVKIGSVTELGRFYPTTISVSPWINWIELGIVSYGQQLLIEVLESQ
jgi:hypothetical protein